MAIWHLTVNLSSQVSQCSPVRHCEKQQTKPTSSNLVPIDPHLSSYVLLVHPPPPRLSLLSVLLVHPPAPHPFSSSLSVLLLLVIHPCPPSSSLTAVAETERILLQPMASQAPAMSFASPTMAPLVPASVSGLMVSSQPAQFHPVTPQMGQGGLWQQVPGALGQLLQLPQGVQMSQGVQPAHLPQPVQPVEFPQGVQLVQGMQHVQLPQGLLFQEGVQLVHLPQGVQLFHEVQPVQLPQGVQQVPLAQGVQLLPVPAAFAPSNTWGQQLMMGTLVPHQPVALGPGAVVQGQPLYPTGSCHLPVPACPSHPPRRGHVAQWVQGPPVPHTQPGSAQKPAQASGKDRVARELGVPTASPHQPALAAPASTTMGKPTAVATQAALESPGDQPQQEPATCAEASLEPAQDIVAVAMSAAFDTTDCGNSVPDVSDSPGLAAFLSELPDLSEAEDPSHREQVAVAGLEDGDVTGQIPKSPTFLSQLLDLSDLYFPNSLRELDGFWEYAAESTQDQVAPAPLGDSEDSGLTTDGPGMTTEVLNELPDLAKAEGGCTEEQVAVEMLLKSYTTFPDGHDSLASSIPATEVPHFWEYGPEADCPEDHLAAATLGDTDPFWEVAAASPSLAPQEMQGTGATDMAPWLQMSPMETPEQSSPENSKEPSEDCHLASPWRDPLTDPLERPLLSPLASPPPAHQPHWPSMAQLMEETRRRQLRVLLTRLPLPPGTMSCRVLSGPGAARDINTKRPMPATAPEGHDTSLHYNIPPKRRR
nr:proline-rich protein 36-like isoform X2 [Columba livia]